MRQASLLALVALVLVGAVLLAQGPAQAQSPQQTYDLSWWTVDGGGTMSATGGDYALSGTAGQPDPGVLSGSYGGDAYELGGGFWRGGASTGAPQYEIYLPLVTKSW